MASNHMIVAGGTDLRDMGAVLSSFSERLPEPKVIKVDIPAGVDLDITDALGAIGYHDGHHTLTLYVIGNTEAERVRKAREIVALLHGRKMDYRLSWDNAYTFTGRFAVSLDRMNPYGSKVVLDIERSPWKRGRTLESVDVNCHPSATHALAGSTRFHTVKAKLLQSGTTKVGTEDAESRSAGTYTLASDLYIGEELTFTVADWLMYLDGTDYVVNPTYWGGVSSAGDATINSPYTVTDAGDMVFSEEAKQHVTLSYYRWDL